MDIVRDLQRCGNMSTVPDMLATEHARHLLGLRGKC